MRRFVAAFALLALAILSTGCFLNVTSHVQSDGSIIYTGEVYNGGDPLSQPYVEGTFYDAAGNVITTQVGEVCNVLPSKSVSAFRVELPAGTAQPARVEWKLLGETVADAYLATGLTAEVTNIVPNAGITGETNVYGELRNTSNRTYRNAYLCIGWTNDKGEVLEVGWGFGAGIRLDPGQSMPFEVIVDEIPAAASRLNFYLDAGVSPDGPPPAVVDLPASALKKPLDVQIPTAGGAFRISAVEVHNTSQATLFPAVIATIRDSAGKLLSTSGNLTFCQVAAPPGGFTYASYSLTLAAQTVPTPALRVEALNWNRPTDPTTYALAPTNVDYTTSGGITRVTGTIRNTTDETLTRVNACAGVYDASGDLVGVYPTEDQVTLPAAGLAPNASVNVTIEVPTFGTAASAKLIADGYE